MAIEEDRRLTEDDVKAIVTELKTQLITDFYGEIGRGVWTFVKKWLFIALLVVALYGALNDRSFIQALAAGK